MFDRKCEGFRTEDRTQHRMRGLWRVLYARMCASRFQTRAANAFFMCQVFFCSFAWLAVVRPSRAGKSRGCGMHAHTPKPKHAYVHRKAPAKRKSVALCSKKKKKCRTKMNKIHAKMERKTKKSGQYWTLVLGCVHDLRSRNKEPIRLYTIIIYEYIRTAVHICIIFLYANKPVFAKRVQ